MYIYIYVLYICIIYIYDSIYTLESVASSRQNPFGKSHTHKLRLLNLASPGCASTGSGSKAFVTGNGGVDWVQHSDHLDVAVCLFLSLLEKKEYLQNHWLLIVTPIGPIQKIWNCHRVCTPHCLTHSNIHTQISYQVGCMSHSISTKSLLLMIQPPFSQHGTPIHSQYQNTRCAWNWLRQQRSWHRYGGPSS